MKSPLRSKRFVNKLLNCLDKMNLVPIAKPVRIRVECGGEEHISMDSLLEYFCCDDIEELYLNGSLNKFLSQSGKEMLPNCTNIFQIADVLYESNGEIKDEETLLLWWLQDKKYSRNIELFLEYLFSDKESDEDRIKQFTSYSNVSLKAFLGDFCFEKALSASNLTTRKTYLQLASEFGNKDAKTSLNEIEEAIKKDIEEKRRNTEYIKIIRLLIRKFDESYLSKYRFDDSWYYEYSLNWLLNELPGGTLEPFLWEHLFYFASVIAQCSDRKDLIQNVLNSFMLEIPEKATKADVKAILRNEIENAEYLQEPLKKDFRQLVSRGGRVQDVKRYLDSYYKQFGLWK